MARVYVVAGQANSVRFGNGLFDWAFNNLDAVIDLEDYRRSDEDVRARFRTCLEVLRRRDLTFLGAVGGTWPNAFVISNIVRFYGTFHESDAVAQIRTYMRTYSSDFVTAEKECLRLARTAVAGKVIFWPKQSKLQMLRYPAQVGYFTPIF